MTLNQYSYPEVTRATHRPVDVNLERFFPAERLTMGVDLGQSNDPTAICVVKRVARPGEKPAFDVLHLERLPLGMSYVEQVERVVNLLTRPQLRGKTELVIDYTGVGRPVANLFQEASVTPTCITITGGRAITNEGLIWSVPKGEIISRIQSLLHTGQLRISPSLPDAFALKNELSTMQADFTDTGYIKFNARSGAHDDLVLALGIALWKSYGQSEATSGLFEFTMRQAFGLVPKRSADADKSPTVKIRSTLGTPPSTIYTIDSRAVYVDPDGAFLVSTEEAKPLLADGWIIVEEESALASA
jgi:hypothetical protein